MSFGQENQAIAEGTETTFKTNLKEGVFSFILPEGTSAEEVKRNSAYYTSFFTVNYDASSRKSTLTMVENSSEGRHVIVRFLISNKVRTVKLGTSEYTVSEFYEKYLK